MRTRACHSLDRGWCASRPPVKAPLTAHVKRDLDGARPRRSKASFLDKREWQAMFCPVIAGAHASRRSALDYRGYVGCLQRVLETAKQSAFG
jgi:hypothetical protein